MKYHTIALAILIFCLPVFAETQIEEGSDKFEAAVLDVLSDHPEIFPQGGRLITPADLWDYEDKIITKSESFYNNRFNWLLVFWTVGIGVLAWPIWRAKVLSEKKLKEISDNLEKQERDHQDKFQEIIKQTTSSLDEAHISIGELADKYESTTKATEDMLQSLKDTQRDTIRSVCCEMNTALAQIIGSLCCTSHAKGDYPITIPFGLKCIELYIESALQSVDLSHQEEDLYDNIAMITGKTVDSIAMVELAPDSRSGYLCAINRYEIKASLIEDESIVKFIKDKLKVIEDSLLKGHPDTSSEN